MEQESLANNVAEGEGVSALTRLGRRLRPGAARWLRPLFRRSGVDTEAVDEVTRRIVLVLSGGGLRGLVHVGAWRALLEVGLRPDAIVGTSIGALVGAAAASGADWDHVERAARSVVRKEIAALDRRVLLLNGIRRPALFRGEVLRRYMEWLIDARTFDELAIPLQVNAVDLGTGEMRWFGSLVGTTASSPVGSAGSSRGPPVGTAGIKETLSEPVPAGLDPAGKGSAATAVMEVDSTVELLDAVWASCAVPTFYPPVRIGDSYFIDGGILDTFALRRAAAIGATWILAVDATTEGVGDDPEELIDEGMLTINERVFGIVSAQRRRAVLKNWSGPPLTIVRPEASHVPAFDFEFNDYLVDEGHRAMREALEGAGAEHALHGVETEKVS